MFQAQVFTLYPEVFPGPLSKGLYGKALSNKLWNLSVINIRDAATDKHKTVDDTPYGGGTGMLLKADVLAKALDQKIKKGERVFYLSPRGKKFDQKLAKNLSKEKAMGDLAMTMAVAYKHEAETEDVDRRKKGLQKNKRPQRGAYSARGGR